MKVLTACLAKPIVDNPAAGRTGRDMRERSAASGPKTADGFGAFSGKTMFARASRLLGIPVGRTFLDIAERENAEIACSSELSSKGYQSGF